MSDRTTTRGGARPAMGVSLGGRERPWLLLLLAMGQYLFLVALACGLAPRFESVFAEGEVALPGLTEVVLQASQLAVDHWYLLPAPLLLALLLVFVARRAARLFAFLLGSISLLAGAAATLGLFLPLVQLLKRH